LEKNKKMAGGCLRTFEQMIKSFPLFILIIIFNLNIVCSGQNNKCIGNGGSDWENYGAVDAVNQHKISAVPPPSIQTPFIFLHCPKTGGSTIRKQLIDVGVRFNIGGERLSPIGGYKVKHDLGL
jgi:hypothetical protein